MQSSSEAHERAYAEMDRREMILRDWLAVDRTVLANERTLLSYIRTSLGGAAVGGSLLKFFDSKAAAWTGVLFLIAAIITATIGLLRFNSVRRRLAAIGRKTVDPITESAAP